jgi:hypothetical protein
MVNFLSLLQREPGLARRPNETLPNQWLDKLIIQHFVSKV